METINKKKSNTICWERYWGSKKHIDEVYSNADRVISQIIKATPLQNKRILEVGAGTGRDGFRLVDAGAVVFLLDHSGKSLNLMKDWAVENRKHVVLIKADAEALPFKNQCFDVVFHQGLLEHFPNPKPILRENYRVLSVGGILLVDVPQTFHVYTIIKHLLISFNAWFAGWETQFTVSELGRLVCSVGLKVRNFYGDWMHPSLMYRLLRELLLKIGLRIPMYPKGFGVTRAVLKMMLRVLDRFPVFLYTCLDIGVVAEKLSEKRS